MTIQHSSLNRAQATRKLSVRRKAESCRSENRHNQSSENDRSSFHSAPRNVSRMQSYAPLSRALETNPPKCSPNATPVRVSSESVAQRTVVGFKNESRPNPKPGNSF